MMECLLAQEYMISIIATQSFSLYISVNGIDVLQQEVLISFKPFNFMFDTCILYI